MRAILLKDSKLIKKKEKSPYYSYALSLEYTHNKQPRIRLSIKLFMC